LLVEILEIVCEKFQKQNTRKVHSSLVLFTQKFGFFCHLVKKQGKRQSGQKETYKVVAGKE